MQPRSNFFSLLFDLSFDRFVTPRIVRVIYALSIVLAGLAALGISGGPFGSVNGAAGLFSLVIAVLIFFAYVIAARVTLEALIALFKIAENTSTLAGNSRPESPPSPQEPLP